MKKLILTVQIVSLIGSIFFLILICRAVFILEDNSQLPTHLLGSVFCLIIINLMGLFSHMEKKREQDEREKEKNN